jgi:fructan beta-fructosidase
MKRKIMKQLVFKDQRGQGLAEYGLLLMAVALTAVGILSLLGVRVSDLVCEVAEGLGAEASCNNMLFFDDFSEGSAKWHSFFGHDDNWTFNDGDDPNLCHTGRGGDVILADGTDGSDYVISTDANLSSGNGYGLFFRTSPNESGRIEGYTFQYDPGYRGGQFIMRKWVNGYELWPPFATATAPPGYDWHDVERQVEVDVNGTVFTAKIDGEEVLVGTDDSYTEGSAGLRAWSGSNACFDDFSVKAR